MKTTTTRLLSVLLCLAMIFCYIPHSALAEASETLNELQTNDTETASATETDVYVLGEVIDSRTESSKTFRMSDGSFVAADYGKPIHYSDENGDWQDYDNTLSYSDAVDSEDIAGYGTSESDISIKLANNSNSGNLLKIQMNGYKISLSLPDANKSKALELYPQTTAADDDSLDSASTLTKFSSGAIYKDILDGTDLEYIISGSNVKENIIVKEIQDSYVYAFELKLNGLVPVLNDDGSIALNDENTEVTQLVIPKGIMSDANYAVSDGVTYSVAHINGNKYTLTVTADAEWINSDDRVFPVKIDPSFFEGSYLTNEVDDSYVIEGQPDFEAYTYQVILSGYGTHPQSQDMRAFFKLNTLPEIPDSAVIVDAVLHLRQMASGNGWMAYNGTEGSSITLAARRVTETWSESTVNWNNQPAVDSIVLDYNVLTAETAYQEFDWDITSAVQGWYSGDPTTPNHGIALYPITEYSGSGAYAYVGFYSIENPNIYTNTTPMFKITYRDTKGLESLWTYSSHGAGNAGAGYVNGFNGNLVFVHDDMATKGSILPITISHVYNSYMAGETFDTSAPAGLGWKLSVQETLTEETIENAIWYKYNDADGTDLYFYHDSTMPNGVYKSEDGYGLTVTVTGSGDNKIATLADDYGNVKVFNSTGRITKIQDVYGNKKEFVYNSLNMLTSITYTPVNETDPITQLVFRYNAYKVLNKITNGYDSSDYVEFFYSSTYDGGSDKHGYGYLRQIQYSSGEICVYNYNSDGTLASAVDFDNGYRVLYTYDGFRVSSITEAVGGTQGQTIGFAYKDKYFSVRSSGNDDVYGNSDDLNTVTLFDNYGRAICSYTEDQSGNIFGASYAKYTENDVGLKTNNKLTVSSVKGITAENLVKNGGCETVSNWTTGYSGSGYSAVANTAEKLNGTYSIKLAHTDNTGYVYKYQNVTIPSPGTYTLSAYVKTSGVTSETGGACIQISSSKSEYVTGTTDTSVQNGWRRISVTRTFDTAAMFSVFLRLDSATGTAYFDNVQLERADIESDYNFIQNSSFRTSSDWTGTYSIAVDATKGYVGAITGSAANANSVYQTIPLNVPVNTTFMVSGWAKANSVKLEGGRTFGLLATITYSDSSNEFFYAPFNTDNTEWQYTTLAITPCATDIALTIASVQIAFVYDYNCNTVYFDDITFTIEPAQSYKYRSDGTLYEAIDVNGSADTTTYIDGIDLETYTSDTGELHTYTYYTTSQGVETHNIATETRVSGTGTQTTTYSYNIFGNIESRILSTGTSNENFSFFTEYSEYGNFLTSSTNSLSGTTSYSYDSVTKLLKYIEDANSNRTAFTYDNRDRVTTVYLDADKDGTADTTESSVAYLYASGRLSGINTATTAYTITYDTFGNMVSVSASGNVLASYTYTAGNGKLTRMTYGNGEYEEYTYDNLDRLVKVTYNGSDENAFTVLYDSNGRLAKAVDGKVGITYFYEYDSLDRLIRAYQKDSSGNTVFAVENSYDEYGRAKGSTYVIDGTAYTYGISYKENTNLVSFYSLPGNSFGYSYDSFDRLTSKINPLYGYTYSYKNGTSLVSSLTVNTNCNGNSDVYSYTYDALGNIVAVRKDGALISAYEYDALGQLIREDDVVNSKAYVYEYDKAGNILKTYTFDSTGPNVQHWMDVYPALGEITETYTYSDSAWGDLLTDYNGTNISYDSIGNPTNWIGIAALYWDGRELDSITMATNHMVDYTYNSDGIRTKKYEYNGNDMYSYTHNYVLDGSTILKETILYSSAFNGNSTTTLEYYYDESGIASFRYNGTVYHYIKNLQGDVIGIVNSNNGGIVVEYTYDAWGNVISITGELASTVGQINPFRYRGYYYDNETGLYYLNSRYYDAEVGRFINADSIIGANGGYVGFNLFAYCSNNTINMADYSGEDAILLHYPERAEMFGIVNFGHTALLLQDKSGTWYYFSWGARSTADKAALITGTKSSYYLDKLGKLKVERWSHIMALLMKSSDDSAIFELSSYVYMKGDFSGAFNYLKSLKGKKYYLLTQNCVQTCMTALRKGKFSKNNSEKQLALFFVYDEPVPNLVFAKWQKFYNSIDTYLEAPWWKQIFMKDPYKYLY